MSLGKRPFSVHFDGIMKFIRISDVLMIANKATAKQFDVNFIGIVCVCIWMCTWAGVACFDVTQVN